MSRASTTSQLCDAQDVDGRDKPGHDDSVVSGNGRSFYFPALSRMATPQGSIPTFATLAATALFCRSITKAVPARLVAEALMRLLPPATTAQRPSAATATPFWR